MKFKYISIAMISAIVVISCKKYNKEKEMPKEVFETIEVPTIKKITLKLEAKSDSQASGSVVFKEEDGIVKMIAVLGGLSEGTHAIHIHESLDCASTDGKSAGGHWNPTEQPHGKWDAAEGYHKGDIGNFEIDESGNGTISKTTDEWCIGCGDANKDILGKAIIVHQGIDDFKSQPSGAAGVRVACGGIIE